MAFLLPTSTLNPARFFNWPYKIITVLQPVFPWLEGLLYFLAVFALWSLTTNTHRNKTNFLKENYLGLQLAESNEACLGQENSLYMYLWSKKKEQFVSDKRISIGGKTNISPFISSKFTPWLIPTFQSSDFLHFLFKCLFSLQLELTCSNRTSLLWAVRKFISFQQTTLSHGLENTKRITFCTHATCQHPEAAFLPYKFFSSNLCILTFDR